MKGQFSDASEDEQVAITSVNDSITANDESSELSEENYDTDEELYFEQITLDDEWDASGGVQTMSQVAPTANTVPIKGQILNYIDAKNKVVKKPHVDKEAEELNLKYGNRIRLDPLDYFNQAGASKKADDGKYLLKDKADRATVEQVLDPRTRMILFKLINRGTIQEVNGCISTGKEANVYHAQTPEGGHLAIKIYKTSILVFKDRDRYVAGEFRFRHGYSKSNPRKMVQTWAEKEMRNLKRLQVNGIPCPEAVVLRLHVLVMTLIGDKNGWAAPRLKDAVIKEEKTYKSLYRQLVRILWVLYNKCKLVHADFSEYNLLFYKGLIYVIDVSQSVEHDHPHALEFLRKDVTNIVEYFRKKLTHQIMTVRELFDFVVADYSKILEKVPDSEGKPETEVEVEIEQRPDDYLDDSVIQSNEQVFKNVYIPRTLEEIVTAERDVETVKKGGQLVYESVTGLNVAEAVRNQEVESEEHDDELSSDDGESDDSESDDGESDKEGDPEKKKSRLKKDEDREAKNERKRLTREQKKLKRETKIPKSLKKRKTKKGK
ncbi:hypothetical protein HDV01_005786 [Terramyces sp. JEL0728]|nr:hypothetical protein HDV01_005786 [Terramyces sp. JEL0728]